MKRDAAVRRCSGVWRMVVGALALLLAGGCVDRLPDQDLRILDATPVAKMSTDLLWKEFQTDAAAARRRYWGQAIEVTGTVASVGTNAPGNRFVLFAQDATTGIRAHLLDDQAASILSSVPDRRRLTLKCYCEGTAGSVTLRSCVKP